LYASSEIRFITRLRHKISMEAVLIEPDCVAALVSSVLEVYNKETSGYLMSRPNMTVKRIDRKDVKLVSLSYAYPFQTDKRTPTYVFHKNRTASIRVVDSLYAMGVDLIGGFHSHIYPHDTALISDNDVDYTLREMLIANNNGIKMDKWLELILAVKKNEYKTKRKIGYEIKGFERGVKINVNTGEDNGFDIKIVGYWIIPKDEWAIKRQAHVYTKYNGKIC